MMSVAPTVNTSPDDAHDCELAVLAKALGHPARVRIIRLLLGRESCFCGEIVEHLPLAQATVSQHLKVLRDAGLIRGEIEGPRTCYWADADRLARLRDRVDDLLGDAAELEDGCGCR